MKTVWFWRSEKLAASYCTLCTRAEVLSLSRSHWLTGCCYESLFDWVVSFVFNGRPVRCLGRTRTDCDFVQFVVVVVVAARLASLCGNTTVTCWNFVVVHGQGMGMHANDEHKTSTETGSDICKSESKIDTIHIQQLTQAKCISEWPLLLDVVDVARTLVI